MISTDIEPGTRISEYILIERIGRGGFAEVWKARHHVWDDKIVAVKIPLDSDFVKQLKLEGVIQHRLRHPNIVETYGLDPYSDPPYFVMEYVDGESLHQRLKRVGKLTADETMRVSIQVLQGLSHAHDQGIIHRDIKPSNILITADSHPNTGAEGERVKLSDFGLGRAVELATSSLLYSNSLQTSDGTGVSGTICYMSPEQKAPGREADQRSDIYSFGLVFFEMLTGELPQGGEVPSDLNPAVPRSLDDVFSKCYARIEKRFASAQEVVSRLNSSKIDAGGSAKRTGSVDTDDSYITFEDVMDLLSLARKELHDLIVEGRVKALRVRDKVRFRKTQILELRDKLVEGWGGERVRDEEPVISLSRYTGSTPRAETATEQTTSQTDEVAPEQNRPQPQDQSTPPFHSVGFFPRAFARVFDWLIIAAIAYFSVVALAHADTLHANSCCDFPLSGAFHLLSEIEDVGHYATRHVGDLLIGFLITNVAYFTLMTAVFGATFGKALIGARVRKLNGRSVGLFTSVLRAFGSLISWATMGIGFLAAGFNSDKRGLHDLVANTRVIYEPNLTKRGITMVIALLLPLAFAGLVVLSCHVHGCL